MFNQQLFQILSNQLLVQKVVANGQLIQKVFSQQLFQTPSNQQLLQKAAANQHSSQKTAYQQPEVLVRYILDLSDQRTIKIIFWIPQWNGMLRL